jgi:nucleoside-diphosphate-sugar epimerase
MKKSVLITGGTKRLGAYIAAELRTRGWRVLTSSHRADSGADIVADLARPSGAAKLYLKALELEPELSAVVNNAALFTGGADDLRSVNLESAKKLLDIGCDMGKIERYKSTDNSQHHHIGNTRHTEGIIKLEMEHCICACQQI